LEKGKITDKGRRREMEKMKITDEGRRGEIR